jgi:hypothetical protein
MKVSVSFRRRDNLLSKAISVLIAAICKFIISSFLSKYVIGRGNPKELGHNGWMTDEIPLNPRSGDLKNGSNEPFSKHLRFAVTPNIYSFLTKSVVGTRSLW